MTDIRITSPEMLVVEHRMVLNCDPKEWSWFRISRQTGGVSGFGTQGSFEAAVAESRATDDENALALLTTEGMTQPEHLLNLGTREKDVLDVLELSNHRHGFAIVHSSICTVLGGEDCSTCGKMLPVKDIPGQFSGEPLVAGDMTFDREIAFEEAESLMERVLDTEWQTLDDADLLAFGSLLSRPGGRDYVLVKTRQVGALPVDLLQAVADHGRANDPAVHNAVALLGFIRGMFRSDLAASQIGWVLEHDPSHTYAYLLSRQAELSTNLMEISAKLKNITPRAAFDFTR